MLSDDLGDTLPKWTIQAASELLGYKSSKEVPQDDIDKVIKLAVEMSEVN